MKLEFGRWYKVYDSKGKEKYFVLPYVKITNTPLPMAIYLISDLTKPVSEEDVFRYYRGYNDNTWWKEMSFKPAKLMPKSFYIKIPYKKMRRMITRTFKNG